MVADHPVVKHGIAVTQGTDEGDLEIAYTFESLTERETGDMRYFVNQKEVAEEEFFTPRPIRIFKSVSGRVIPRALAEGAEALRNGKWVRLTKPNDALWTVDLEEGLTP